jgi:hypothetical protein
MGSITQNESNVFPATESRKLAWIIATDAVAPTKIVVLRPGGVAPRASVEADDSASDHSENETNCNVLPGRMQGHVHTIAAL